ncbi:hypothetical protein [Arcicella rosea]|uniref:Uncharacterized protein n=1 Tax=Arcicella rosea TaxID=502909 RepID=A0A841EXL6_9BACT|nr:hypothetical protein [Arcicella rosea]MBB6005368.1 hypothetical protein [Arcicella rosea]
MKTLFTHLKVFIALSIISMGTSVSFLLNSCQPCHQALSMPINQKWKVTSIVYRNKGKISLSNTESFIIQLDASNKLIETTYKDNVIKSSVEITKQEGALVNCSKDDFGDVTIYYSNGLRRKIWKSSNENSPSIESTGYVNVLGSEADTLKYYYERIE